MFNKKIKLSFYLIITILLTLGLTVSLQSLLAAWTEPGDDPPDGNVNPPIYNVHSTPTTNAEINLPLNILDSSDPTLTLEISGNLSSQEIGSIDFYANDASSWGTGVKANIHAETTNNWGNNAELVFSTSDNSKLATEMMRIDEDGNVGIGTTNPLEKLDVNGAIKLGNTTSSNAGTIRWNDSNSHFQGYDGSAWNNLDESGGGSGSCLSAPNGSSPDVVCVDNDGNVIIKLGN